LANLLRKTGWNTSKSVFLFKLYLVVYNSKSFNLKDYSDGKITRKNE
jgi:hypothetical protein